MIMLDTHAWIWWATESKQLSTKANKVIQKANEVGVSVISCWEISMLVAKQRISFKMDVQDWIDKALEQAKISLIPLTPKIAVMSSRLPGEFHGDPADRIIAASCLEKGIPLISCDKRIVSWGQIQTIW